MQEGGCTAATMRPSVQPNYNFGRFISDSFNHKFHHHQERQQENIQQLHRLETVFSFPAASPTIHQSEPAKDVSTDIKQTFNNDGSVGVTAAGAIHEILNRKGDADQLRVPTPQIKDPRNIGIYHHTGDLGCVVQGAKRELSWAPVALHMCSSPALPDSPDYEISEPRSVLDLRTSPPQLPRPGAAAPSYDFSAFSLGDGVFFKNKDVFRHSNVQATARAPHQVLEGGDEPLVGFATPQVVHRTDTSEAYYELRDLGSAVPGAKRRLSWAEEEVELRGFHSSNENGLAKRDPSYQSLPTLPVSAHVFSPSSSPSPNCKIPEPQSVLDWKTSPPPAARSTTAPSNDLTAFTLDDGFLLDDQLFNKLQRQLSGLGEDEGTPLCTNTPPAHELLENRNFHNCAKGGLARSTSYSFPNFPIPAITLLSPRTGIAMPRPPNNKRQEQYSALDFASATHPRVAQSAATPSYECAANSLEGDALLEDILRNFHRQNSSSVLGAVAPKVFGLEENEDEPPPTSTTMEWLEETSQLWDSLLDDDFTYSPRGAISLPRIKQQKDQATNSPSTPGSSHSEIYQNNSSFDQKHSKNQGEDLEEPTTTTTVSTITSEGRAPDAIKAETDVTLEGFKQGSEDDLVNLLLTCAEAVSTMRISLVNPLFAQLGELASPEGTTLQRVAAYFIEGLAYRCTRLWPHIYQPFPDTLELSEEDSISAFHIYNHVCPNTKFAHFTANDVILQAFEGCDLVHVIDFDVKQGLQWPAFFQSLAARPEGPPSQIRVTGVGENKEDVHDAGDRLAEFAEALDLPFEFHAVIDKLEDVRLWMLYVKENETVAVNCMMQLHRTLRDKENGIKEMLGLISSTKPKVVAVVEQEANHNSQFLQGRFLAALQYYSAIFDSLDSKMLQDKKARLKVERLLGSEIRNIVGCEGPERFERHEPIKTWRSHMERGGFNSVPMSNRARTQAQLLLDLFGCQSYRILGEDKSDTLTLCWQSIPLYTASAWAPKL